MLSKRERTVGIVAVAALAIYGVDAFLLSPYLERRDLLEAETTQKSMDLARTTELFRGRRRLERRWSEPAKAILPDASRAESQILNSVRAWANEAGVSLTSVKPERSESTRHFGTSTFRAAGAGGLRSVTDLLARIESAAIPVRISDLQLSSRKEGTDDLFFQIVFSTLHQVAAAPSTGDKTPSSPPATSDAGGGL